MWRGGNVDTLPLVQTTLLVYIQAFLASAGYSCVYVSLMYYLLEFFPRNPNLFFCIIMSATGLTTFIASIVLQKVKLLSRNFKAFILLSTAFFCLGNFCYTFHSKVWFLLVGRVICGLGDTASDIVRGVMGKLLPTKNFNAFNSKYEMISMFGFLLGPVTVAVMFNYKLSFDRGFLIVDQYNGVTFILFWMFLVLFVLMLCCVSDLNAFVKEEQKEYEEDDDDDDDDDDLTIEDNGSSVFQRRRFKFFQYLKSKERRLQANRDNLNTTTQDSKINIPILAKFILTFFACMNLFSNATEMLIVIVAVRTLKLPIIGLCGLTSCSLIIFMVILTKVWRKFFIHEDRKLLSVVACVASSVLSNVFIVLSCEKFVGRYLAIVFIFFATLSNSLCGFTGANVAQNIVFVLISDNKSFDETVTRWMFLNRVCGILGLLLAGFIANHTRIVYIMYAILQLVFLAVVLKEKDKIKTTIAQ